MRGHQPDPRTTTYRDLMANRRPPSSKRTSSRGAAGNADDAFTAGLLEFIGWARQRTQLLVAAAVILVVGVVGIVYMYNQRDSRLEQAAQELESAQLAAFMSGPAEGRAELRAFIDRFRRTPYAIEAYLLLAELHLEEGDAAGAVAALEEIVPAYRSPLEVQATFLLAVALEVAERWDDAAALYEELMDRADFTFQRREAAEGIARTHMARSDRAGAAEALGSILEALEPTDPQRAQYEMRLAELEALGL